MGGPSIKRHNRRPESKDRGRDSSSLNATSITLYLPTGDSKGLRVARVANWSGKAVACPKTEFSTLLTREELSFAGVYILFGSDVGTGMETAYVGEAEVLNVRIPKQRGQEFVSVCTFSSEELTKAHVKYLEGMLINQAKSVGRFKVLNSVRSGAFLGESDRASMQSFLRIIKQLLPILGYDLLTPLPLEPSRKRLLYCKVFDLVARGQRTPDGFVIFKESFAALKERPAAAKHKPHIVALRKELIATGVLAKSGAGLKFVKDVEFSSPSAAAAVVHGGAAAGSIEWKTEDGTTLKDLDERAGATFL
jgi:hypothetical protein